MAEIYEFYHVDPQQVEPDAPIAAPQPIIVAAPPSSHGIAGEGFSAAEIIASGPVAEERLRAERRLAAGSDSILRDVLGDRTSFLLAVGAVTLLALTLLYAGALVAVRLRRRRLARPAR